MRLGLSSFYARHAVAGGGGLAASQAMLASSAALGAQLVQFCENLPLTALPEDDLRVLQAQAAELGLGLEVGTRGVDPDNLSAQARMAARVGSRCLRVMLDLDDLALIRRRLTDLLPALHDLGLTLALENSYWVGSADLAALVRALDDPAVGVCLDTANSLGRLEPPAETLANLAPLAAQVHLKDFVVDKVAIGYHITGRPLGQGLLDLPAVVSALGPRAGALDYCLEYWMDPEPDAAATYAKEQRWLAESLAAARASLGRCPRLESDRAFGP